MTQEELAQRADVNEDTIGKWEKGRAKPQLENVIALSAALGVSIDALIKGEETVADQLEHRLLAAVDAKIAELERRWDERLKKVGL